MRKLGWSSRYNSDFAVRVATQRMIGKAKWEIGKFGI